MKVCRRPGCPTRVPDDAYKGRCAPCNRQVSRDRGTTTELGWGREHRQRRAEIQRRIDAGETVRCWRCHVELEGRAWQLDHDDDRTGWRGPSCTPCNLHLAGKKSHGYPGDGDRTSLSAEAPVRGKKSVEGSNISVLIMK